VARDAAEWPRYRQHAVLGLETVAYRGPLPRMPTHAHAQYQLSLYAGAPRRFKVGAAEFAGDPHCAVMIQAGEPHSSVPVDDERLALRTFYLEPRVITEAADSIWHGRGTVAFRDALVRDPSTVEALLAAHRALDELQPSAEEQLCVALEHLVGKHATPTGAVLSPSGTQARVARVRDLIEDRVADSLSLGELATVADVSRFHLIRLFRQQYGVTPFAYQRNQRVERARAAFRGGGSVSDAVAAGGFADQSHLGRTFRAVMGATPGQYRRCFVSRR
jgi:AraC-like DNA-binding protein